MLKKDLIKEVSQESGQSQEEIRLSLDAVEKVVLRAVAAGREVMLLGLGKLVISERGPKRARHMVTGAPVTVPARRVPLLRVSESLTAAANGDA